jgi:hypothetical protein
MIRIKKTSKLDLKPPEFVCDYELTEHLSNYPQFSFMNVFNTTAIIGKPASGKTSMLISILSQKHEGRIYYKCFDFVYVIMPTQSRNSLKKNIFAKHHPDRLFEDLTLETLETIYADVQKNSLEKKTSLVVYDDVGSSLKNNDIQTLLKKMSFNRRHLKLCQIFLVQSWISTPLTIRKLYSNIILYKPSKIEWETIADETLEYDKDVIEGLLKLYEKPYDYLFINLSSQRIFYNQNEVLVEEE